MLSCGRVKKNSIEYVPNLSACLGVDVKQGTNLPKGSPDIKKNDKKGHIVLFRRPPPPKQAKRAYLFSEKSAQIATNVFLRQNGVCLGSWISLRSFIMVDCQFQILHIKPTCLQVCTQMTCNAQFVSMHSLFPSDLRPW